MEKKNRTGSEIAPSRAAVADVQSVEASIRARIFTIRGVQVMLDRDLAALYGVQTSRLNEQVKRNRTRFPAAFMFQLSHEEMKNWISQIATSNLGQSIKMGFRSIRLWLYWREPCEVERFVLYFRSAEVDQQRIWDLRGAKVVNHLRPFDL